MKQYPVALLSLILLLGGASPPPAFASNKGEASPQDVPSGETAPEPPTAAPVESPSGAEQGQGTAPESAEGSSTQSDPADSAPSPAAEPAPAEPAPVEPAPRPALPPLSEDSELETVREGDTPPSAAGVTVSPATLELLRALETRHASVVTVKGSFDQLKISEIFLEEIRSKGTFWYQKPDLFRCDYEPPDEMTNLILKDAIYVYVPSIEQCEIYRFSSEHERDQQLHSMVLGFGFKTDELLNAYTVTSSEDGGSLSDEVKKAGQATGDTALLHLIPLPAMEETSPFTSLKLWIDKGSLLPEKVSFEDYNGDKTMIELRSIDLNAAVDAKQFVPTFPPGTEYIDKSEASSGN